MSTPGTAPGSAGRDESIVGARLLIKHTVRMDEYEFLETLAHEEGCVIDDVYLRIMNEALLAAMGQRIQKNARRAALQALEVVPATAEPKPGAKKQARKAAKKAPAATAKKAPRARKKPTARKPATGGPVPARPAGNRKGKKVASPAKAVASARPTKPAKQPKAKRPPVVASPEPAAPVQPKPALTKPEVKLVKAPRNLSKATQKAKRK